MRVKALRIYVLDRRKQPESSSLTGSRALDQLRKGEKKGERSELSNTVGLL